MKPRTLTLAETLAGAERAAKRIGPCPNDLEYFFQESCSVGECSPYLLLVDDRKKTP